MGERTESCKLRIYKIRGAESAAVAAEEEMNQRVNVSTDNSVLPEFPRSPHVRFNPSGKDSRPHQAEVSEKIVEEELRNLTVVRIAGDNSLELLEQMKATPIGRFYAKHLKPYPLCRRLFACLVHNVYLVATFHFANTFGRDKKLRRWRPLKSLNALVKAHHLSAEQLTPATQSSTALPRVFPVQDSDCLRSEERLYRFPGVYVATISQGTIYGGTNMNLVGEEVICHDLQDFKRDSTAEELHGRLKIDCHRQRARWLSHDLAPVHIPEAATFIDACAHNYAHWLTEVLPRIAVFCAADAFRDVPLVVNAGLHENIMESLRAVVGSERLVFTLPTERAVQVDTLYVTSVAGYVPFERRRRSNASHVHGLFSQPCLELIREKAFAAVRPLPSESWPEKVFLRRNSTTRGILNIAELETLLVDRGYVAVSPETLSFSQQIQLFSSVKEIIAPTGAAIANAIFCQPDAKICVLMAKHPDMIYRYWLNMLSPLQVDVSYVLGKQTRNLDLGIHADFVIAPDDMQSLLTAWEAA